MVQSKMGVSSIGSLPFNIAILHFHDYGRKSTPRKLTWLAGKSLFLDRRYESSFMAVFSIVVLIFRGVDKVI